MLNAKQERIIEKYVNDKYFDVDRLKKYLSMHSIVGNEVFGYCDRHKMNTERSTYSRFLDDERGYDPLDVDTFLRRVPFFFYVPAADNENTLCSLNEVLPTRNVGKAVLSHEELECFYSDLEFMYYRLGLSLVDIFNYEYTQCSRCSGIFSLWRKYLHFCVDRLGWTDYMPERFISKYNEALEACGLLPVIYEIKDNGHDEPFWRDGSKLVFEGQFPCDDNGRPILRWIGIRCENVKDIYCDCEKSEAGTLTVTVTPTSTIHVLNFYNGQTGFDDFWYQVYAGPQRMKFDHNTLKRYRTGAGLTQKEVADAVGAAVRTYQKWENGTTTPDGHYLLRLMNWLDISSVQELIVYG